LVIAISAAAKSFGALGTIIRGESETGHGDHHVGDAIAQIADNTRGGTGHEDEGKRCNDADDNAPIEQCPQAQMLEEGGVEERARDRAHGLNGIQHADELLREFERVGHIEIERRIDAGTEEIEEEKPRDHPKAAVLEGRGEAAEGLLQTGDRDGAFLLVDEQKRAGNHQGPQLGPRGRALRALAVRGGEPFDQQAARDRSENRGDVGPQPLQIDEAVANRIADPLDEQRAAEACS
jgi:hypothetical protein